MAYLTSLDTGGNPLTVNSGIYHTGGGASSWVRHLHCGNARPEHDRSENNLYPYAGGYLHFRTPLPAEGSLIRGQTFQFEIVGFHTYGGSYMYDTKDILHVDGNDVFQVNYGSGAELTTYGVPTRHFYVSHNTYGSYKRICVAIQKHGCCCVGWDWMRVRGSASLNGAWQNYGWGSTGGWEQTNDPANPFF